MSPEIDQLKKLVIDNKVSWLVVGGFVLSIFASIKTFSPLLLSLVISGVYFYLLIKRTESEDEYSERGEDEIREGSATDKDRIASTNKGVAMQFAEIALAILVLIIGVVSVF